jgi:hypothetical protein
MKPAPKFWWDFAQPGESPIIVQSDYKGGERLAKFYFEKYADKAIEQAETLIADFEAGRKTPEWRKTP